MKYSTICYEQMEIQKSHEINEDEMQIEAENMELDDDWFEDEELIDKPEDIETAPNKDKNNI